MTNGNNHRFVVNRDESEIISEIEDLICEYGVRGVVSACLKSSGGEAFEKLGGNASLRIAHAILREIIVSEDPQLEAEIMALGVGLVMEGQNMRTIGERHGITKQAVSKRVVAFVEENGLPPSTYMRSEKDRQTYALTNQPRSAA